MSYPNNLTTSQLGSTAITPVDGIDRIKELLSSAIDTTYRHTHVISIAINRIAGPRPKEVPATIPQPPISERTVYHLLGELEQAQRSLDDELARIREQLP